MLCYCLRNLSTLCEILNFADSHESNARESNERFARMRSKSLNVISFISIAGN